MNLYQTLSPIDKLKLIIGCTLLFFTFFGLLSAFCYLYDWIFFGDPNRVMGRGNEGGASNLPVFFGLMGLAGAILIATIKPSKVSNSE